MFKTRKTKCQWGSETYFKKCSLKTDFVLFNETTELFRHLGLDLFPRNPGKILIKKMIIPSVQIKKKSGEERRGEEQPIQISLKCASRRRQPALSDSD